MSSHDQLVKALESLVDQPAVQRLLLEASGLRDQTMRAQEATLGALHIPSSDVVARLERRLRSLDNGISALQQHLDRLEVRSSRTEKLIADLVERIDASAERGTE